MLLGASDRLDARSERVPGDRTETRRRGADAAEPAAKPLALRGVYADLHLHLGGAILPNILYAYLRRERSEGLLAKYPTQERFEAFFAKKRKSLSDYLKMHALVEDIQRADSLRYFVQKLVRGAVLFDNLAYVELRYTPFVRTDRGLDEDARIEQMRAIVETVREASTSQPQYPLTLRQILCVHSRLSERVNRAIVDLALAMHGRADGAVCAIDIAGPDALYHDRIDEFVGLLKRARRHGLRTTAHVYETRDGHHPQLLPYLDRIGHGIQLPLEHPRLLREIAKRGQCLEVCPTTYIRTGTLKSYEQLRDVLARCFDAGVAVAICTDNSGLHQVRLPMEFENLLVRDIIDFHQMQACHANAYTHAFGWRGPMRSL